MNFKTILTVIVVIVALYLLYYFLLASKTSSLISQMPAMSETKLKIVKAKDLEQQWGTDFAFSIWYAVDNWNTNTTVKKNIFSVAARPASAAGGADTVEKTIPNAPDLEVFFDANVNDIIIKLAGSGATPTDCDYGGTAVTPAAGEFCCKIVNVPLQKWTNLIISINDRVLDVYLDGKLVKTCIMQAPPLKLGRGSSKNVYVGGYDSEKSFGGFISGLRHFGTSINPRKAWDIYKKGHEGEGYNLFSSFNVKFSLLKNDVEIESTTL